MAKRKGIEAVIVEFFMSAPPDAAATLLGVARAIVAKRGIAQGMPVLGPASVPRRRGRPALDLQSQNSIDVTHHNGPLPAE